MADLEFTHRRKNPLTDKWVLVSPHRNNRPWLGSTESNDIEETPKYDESCPLCPSNSRANGQTNPNYQHTHVFINDFGALNSETIAEQHDVNPLFQAEPATGESRVVCFSPEHNKSLPELTHEELKAVVDTWQTNYVELTERFSCVHIFENKGAVMGCSQPHPHGQIWAHDYLSTEISQEDKAQQDYFQTHNRNLLADYVEHETKQSERVVAENEHWLVVVPFWAAWPFETLLIAKDNIQHFGQLSQGQKSALAEILKILTTRYDNVFNCSFPYSMGWHNAPSNNDETNQQHWRLHAHFYPPLLRSATVKKHMVGYEMLAESQRDLTPETAAKILREASSIHYKEVQ